MKSTLTIILVCFMTLTSGAQNADLLKGKWQFKDIADKQNMDSLTLNYAKETMSKTEFEFAADGKYFFGQTEMGTWSLNKEENKVTVVVPDKIIRGKTYPGKTIEMPIRSVTDKELVIGTGQITLVMQKAPPRPPAPSIEKSGLTVEFNIKSKGLSFMTYPGWSNLTWNETRERLDRKDSKIVPSVIYKEAPSGWLKDEYFFDPLYVRMDTSQNSSLLQIKNNLVERFRIPKNKLLEESITMPNGKKGMVLFHITYNQILLKNSFSCLLVYESEKELGTVIVNTIAIDAGVPDLPFEKWKPWMDYFKNVLLAIRPNAVIAFSGTKTEANIIKTEQGSAEINPFDVVKIVRKGTANDLLKYCEKFGIHFTTSEKNGNIEYNAKDPFVFGVKFFMDAKNEGLVVDYIFYDNEQKRKYMNLLKSEGFTGKKLSTATALLTNEGVDIWFIPGTQKWLNSRLLGAHCSIVIQNIHQTKERNFI